MSSCIQLEGINGSNPLGFLAALGTLGLISTVRPDVRLSWQIGEGAWRPVIYGCDSTQNELLDILCDILGKVSLCPFMVADRLPFPVSTFQTALKIAQQEVFLRNRRSADLLVALGDENYPEKELLQETSLRMVRSGDSKGQGLLTYAFFIRATVTREELLRTLFSCWDYIDNGYSLRWDPIEDQSYALRADDPSKAQDKNAPRIMNGANALALEGMKFFPVFCVGRKAHTTGFGMEEKRNWFSWPIWDGRLNLDVIRSLVSFASLQGSKPNNMERQRWQSMSIVMVFRSEIVRPNQYYSNFSPAYPA